MAAEELYLTPLINDADLVSYYRYEGNANDSSGNSHNGTVANTTFSSSYGQFGQGAYNTGGAAGINIGNTFNPTTTWTINFWCKLNSIPSSEIHFFNKGLTGYSYSSIVIYASSSTLRTIVSANSDRTISASLASTGSLSTSEYQMWTLVADGSTLKFYLNGTLDNSTTWTNSLWVNSYNAIIMGSYNGSVYSQGVNGKMDDISLFNRNLTTTEINDLYTGGFFSPKTNWFL